jgi:hypothetical protein
VGESQEAETEEPETAMEDLVPRQNISGNFLNKSAVFIQSLCNGPRLFAQEDPGLNQLFLIQKCYKQLTICSSRILCLSSCLSSCHIPVVFLS